GRGHLPRAPAFGSVHRSHGAGTTIHEVRARLGHRSIVTTNQYAHLFPARYDAVAEGLEALSRAAPMGCRRPPPRGTPAGPGVRPPDVGTVVSTRCDQAGSRGGSGSTLPPPPGGKVQLPSEPPEPSRTEGTPAGRCRRSFPNGRPATEEPLPLRLHPPRGFG